ncbi:hypothetical protein, partial [Clostridium botulinum]
FIKLKWIIIAEIDYWKLKKNLKKIISLNQEIYVVFSHEADSSGGAPVVLFDTAKSIKKDGKYVIFLYKRGGNLIEKCKNYGMDAYVYESHLERYIKILSNNSIKCTIVNTVVCGECVEKMQSIVDTPIIWWIHEIDELVNRFSYTFPRNLNSNVYIRGVSEKSCQAMKKYYNSSIKIMHYGC